MAAPEVFVAISLLVWWRWGRYPAVLLGLAGACTGLTRLGDLVNRPRPTSTVEWTGYSFGNGGYPSGHVVFSVLVLGTVAVLARRHATPRIAMWIVGSMQLLIAVTSWTRVSRLEHWPLDVMGGGLMAAAGLLGIIWLHPRLAAMVARRPLLGRLLLAPGTSYSTDHLEV
jgi:membrane-associated phospholipid phosphatase